MLVPETKRRLEEMKVLYYLEPSLKDLYVEGTTDLSILRWFFEKIRKKDVHIYSIDLVEVPDNVFEQANLSKHSNRNKVIVLAEELSKHFDQRRISAKCIADVDYDRHLGRCRNNYILEYTDYTSFEMYFFNNKYVGKFVDIVLHGFPVSSAILMRDMKNVLQRIFLIRLANERLGWNMRWLPFRGYISWNRRRVKFDEERFLTNYLTGNGRRKDMKQFQAVMSDFEEQLHQDPRHNIRGHDFTYLFFLTAKRYKGRRAGFKDVETFERALCGCLELDFLKDEKLFVRLGTL